VVQTLIMNRVDYTKDLGNCNTVRNCSWPMAFNSEIIVNSKNNWIRCYGETSV